MHELDVGAAWASRCGALNQEPARVSCYILMFHRLVGTKYIIVQTRLLVCRQRKLITVSKQVAGSEKIDIEHSRI